MHDQGIDERIHHQVVFSFGAPEKMSAIVQMRGNTSVLVWTVRMIMDADVLNDRVDLDSVDTVGAKPQCVGDVIARTRSDHQYIAKGGAAAVSLQQMDEGIGSAFRREWDHSLMRDPVHLDVA